MGLLIWETLPRLQTFLPNLEMEQRISFFFQKMDFAPLHDSSDAGKD